MAPDRPDLDTRYRAGFAYVDAVLADGEILPLCRLRYGGSAHQWGFAIYRASHDDYEDSYLPTGYPVGTCEEALDTACGLYLNTRTSKAACGCSRCAGALLVYCSHTCCYG